MPSSPPHTVAAMSEQPPPEVLQRSDPTAIIAGAALGLQAVDTAMHLLDKFQGENAPPPPDPPAPEVILPPSVERD